MVLTSLDISRQVSTHRALMVAAKLRWPGSASPFCALSVAMDLFGEL
jgi:hypothetical protein